MNLKQMEKVVTDHLIESTGIKESIKAAHEKIEKVDGKINWVMGLIALVFMALLVNALR